MEAVIGAAFPLGMLLVMFLFGLYTHRNVGWVFLCMVWGAIGYGVSYFFNTQLHNAGMTSDVIAIIFSPLGLQTFVSLGVLFVVHRLQYDNLVDGAVFGFAAGLGYALLQNVEYGLAAPSSIELTVLRSFSVSLVLATASGIVGLIITQFYFRHRANRLVILLSGLGAAIGYHALFNLLVVQSIGGQYMPVMFSIGGITFVGLYVTGQLRTILMQLAKEKQRIDDLLKIVIPIGVQLSTEENFGRLLENMLVEAKSFCKADAGTLYLMKEDRLEFSVLRNDTLGVAMGGTTNEPITMPALRLTKEDGKPNHNNVATYAALTGKTVNIADAYETKEFDLSSTRAFDKTNGYQSISFLTIPLKNNEGKVLGVLQLINALNSKREIVPFDQNLQQLMESFSSLATAALEGYIEEQRLRNEIKELRIEIDAAKRSKQVEDITNTDYFKNLQERAKNLRNSNTGPVDVPKN